MRRRRTAPTSSNLLLDTLTNALGGIIFIALLVALLAYQSPVLDGLNEAKLAFSEKEVNAMHKELETLPAMRVIEEKIADYKSALEKYRNTELPPSPSQSTVEALESEKAELTRQNKEKRQGQASYRIPELRSSKRTQNAYVVVFKENKVYSGVLDTSKALTGSVSPPRGLAFEVEANRLWIRPVEGKGLDLSRSLEELLRAVDQTHGFIEAEDCRLFLFVYPDSIENFHRYRRQAMKMMPYSMWLGLEDKRTPMLLLDTGGGKQGTYSY
ncbi:hypothetical protein [Coraliomargarita parva]|uniref:hypothetical protein n=1 Tax=Coraliomargarita parva TaxID=3014050 RepID=UPI0022B40EEB|nr:hypothetical protein [Coraliomargarita parva]